MGSAKEAKGSDAQSGGTSAEKPLAIGDVVVTSVDPASGEGKPTEQSGVIVDDFAGSLAKDEADYGRDWALAKRWAIKLDDGRLVFRSSEDVARPAG
ncbi:hypothetical protein ACFYVR_16450 [Rhodococcus sp. NPDC003318]|uniref:hypothetical protein n=1 Tax=Rhodococcus sp. NPDC003318 TaxID=3364503 RepID=UPI00367BBCBF